MQYRLGRTTLDSTMLLGARRSCARGVIGTLLPCTEAEDTERRLQMELIRDGCAAPRGPAVATTH